MSSRIIIDGNAIYEVDEECLRKKKEKGAGRGTRKATGEAQKQNIKKAGI